MCEGVKQTTATKLLRSYATSSTRAGSSKPPRGGVRVGTLFLALSMLGIGATSLGLYNYYNSLKTFPPEVRKDLRAALRCKARKDYAGSQNAFHQAWERITSDNHLENKLGLLKVTGISIAWAEMLEEASRRPDQGLIPDAWKESYDVLSLGYRWARDRLESVPAASNEERMRTVSMAVKLGTMAENKADLETESERQLTWAVEEVLRLATQGTAKDTAVRKGKSTSDDEDAILVGELGLPKWVTKTDLGGTLETLGNFYARKGNVEYAMPLYLQTISLLLPPPKMRKEQPSTGEKCHAATIMNNLSSLIASAPSAPSKDIGQVAQSVAWANKSAEIASMALSSATGATALAEAEQCKPTLTVALYNLGMLKLLEGDKKAAKQYLDQAKAKASEWNFKDAENRADEALKSF